MDSGGGASQTGALSLGPVPPSFDLGSFAYGARNARDLGRRGVCYWLSHSQLDATGPRQIFTQRTITEAIGSEGLQAVAGLSLTFDPRHEEVVLHHVRVIRDGHTRDATSLADFELLQREPNMERAIYDGRKTAHMRLADVREGDRVDVAFSIIGANPVLQDRIAWRFVLQWAEPTVETRCVVRVPEARKLSIQTQGDAPPPMDRTESGVRTLDWRAVDMPTYVPEPLAPMSYVGFASVLVADTGTWADVADVFRQHYRIPETLPDDLEGQVLAIAGQQPTGATRLPEALRLVQSSLRYHSVSVGEGGFRPRDVQTIWQTRYGDCKDASVLLVSVLRRLGVTAVPALVSSRGGAALGDELPNVQAFDHCIVWAEVDGKPVWLDPTRAPQAGDLAHLTQAHFDFALPLVADAALLPMVNMPQSDICDIEEKWTFGVGPDAQAELDVKSVYRAWRADSLRNALANESLSGLARMFREGLERELASTLSERAPMTIRDDAVCNALTVEERYTVATPFKPREGASGPDWFFSRDDLVGPQLHPLGPGERREPLALGVPRRLSTRRVFDFGGPMEIPASQSQLVGPGGLTLSRRYEALGREGGVLTLTLTVPTEQLAASEAPAYREFLARAEAHNGINFPAPPKRPLKRARASDPLLAEQTANSAPDRRPRGRLGDGLSNWTVILMVLAVLAAARLWGMLD